MTRQLLAFSRKQPQALRVLEVNQVVGNIAKMLPRLIGEDIKFSFVPGQCLGQVRIDPVQLEQVLMNLAANARDAMPEGGHLSIETSDAHLTSDYIHGKPAVIPLGRYTLITVTDDGCGIPREDLPQVNDPSNSSKPSSTVPCMRQATFNGHPGKARGWGWRRYTASSNKTTDSYGSTVNPGLARFSKSISLACRVTTQLGKASLRDANQFPAERKRSCWWRMNRRFVMLRGNFSGCKATV